MRKYSPNREERRRVKRCVFTLVLCCLWLMCGRRIHHNTVSTVGRQFPFFKAFPPLFTTPRSHHFARWHYINNESNGIRCNERKDPVELRIGSRMFVFQIVRFQHRLVQCCFREPCDKIHIGCIRLSGSNDMVKPVAFN